MKLTFLILSAYIVPTFCGVKPLDKHFSVTATDKPPSPQTGLDSEDPDLESIQMQFHKDNTLTQDLLPEEEEDDDEYLDFDALLAKEDDDYIDVIDEIEDVPEIDTDLEPSDPAAKRAKLLKLFRGKTRIQRLNTVNANFAFGLYRSIRNAVDQSDNILLAPVGISITLGMVSLGARHETHQQLFNALGFADFVNASVKYDTMTVHNLFHRLTHRLFRHNFGYTLRAVNNLFIRQDAQILNNFTQNMKTYYFVEPLSTNFSDPALISKLNERILKITKGLIKDALKTIDPQTLIMILNCFYLKGTWETKFPTEKTSTGSFWVNEKKVVRVPMMHTKGNFLAAADRELECDILQLPYVGNISMLIVVPRKFSGMRTVEKQLMSEVVAKWLNSMTNRTRKVVLPRFDLEKQYDLVPYLRALGLTLPFQADADFTGISTQENLGINLFKHQGSITVNEEGTTAASITTVGFMPLSLQNEFSVNKPFLFLIYEHRTECLLYMGRVTNPLND
ncbi:heparin cofactor 2 [Stegostoma tigrinum]|uniref:heparin cofactor 2 n=1 Tax=Stegostoma tigrinum TaxID=3053191 RepID=UPI00202B32DB|nr:heparin cofactor 2 [Stegostoma tigrinum]XP_048412274.1 heparin cofactor 2 [Stegostoma tigrinum]